ncbi:hypothetical protein J6E39_00705 [bacterium]|nr:hypothetical protein [bacterium]
MHMPVGLYGADNDGSVNLACAIPMEQLMNIIKRKISNSFSSLAPL